MGDWTKFNKRAAPAVATGEEKTFEELYPDYANPIPPGGGVDHAVEAAPAAADTYTETVSRPASEYDTMPWSDVASKAASNAWPSAKKTVTDTASAIYNYDKTLPALAETATGFLRKGVSAVTGNEPDMADPDTKKDIAAADAIIGDYKDKYGSSAGFKKRLAEDPFNIGMDAASVIPVAAIPTKVGALSKVPLMAKTARAAELALDPVQATVALGKKVASKTASGIADGAQWTQRYYTALHSGKGVQPYQIIQDAGKIRGPEGVKARETLSRYLAGKGSPEEIADTATAAFEEIQKKASDDYKAKMGDITQFTQELPFNRLDTSANDLRGYLKKGHPTDPDRAVANEVLDIVLDRATDPDPAMRNIEGFDRLKKDVRLRIQNIQDANLKKKVAEIANSAKQTIVDVDPKYAELMEHWQDYLDKANDLKKTLGTGNDRLADSAFIKKLQSSLKDDRKGDLVRQLSETQSGSQLPYMIAGDSLKSLMPDWVVGNLAGAVPAAAAYVANPSLLASAPVAIAGALAASPKAGAKITQATSAMRRLGSGVGDKAGTVVDRVNTPLVTQPLYQEGREERATGGRVGVPEHERIGNRLVAQAERAKKSHGAVTSSLLGSSDEMVAKALAVANRGL